MTYISRRQRANEYTQMALERTAAGVSLENYNPQIIVSITTVPSRLPYVHVTIESIFQQTIQPNKVILWLDDNFNNINLTPPIINQTKRGLTINRCSNMGSYAKLIPTLKMFSKEIIITADDDMFYPSSWLEKLYHSYLKNPEHIHGHHCRFIQGKSYKNWETPPINPNNPNMIIPYGVGGILYPPNCFDDNEILNSEKFISLAPFHDDIWFKAMSLRCGRISKQIDNNLIISNLEIFTIPDTQKNTLSSINIKQGDIQFENVFNKYNLFDKE